MAKVTSQADAAILDAVGAEAGKLILDVACGPGRLSEAALQRRAAIRGIDFAPNMIRLAKERNPQGHFQEGDAEALPYPDGEFDAVVCSCGILHFPDPELAMSEAFRVLKSGGRYAFSCWLPPARSPLFALLLGSIQSHGTMDLDLPEGPPLFRFAEASECDQGLRSAGFGSVTVAQVPVVWTQGTAQSLLEDLLSSSARIGPMLAQQSAEQRSKIQTAIIDAASGYVIGGRLEIPAPVLVACGQKA